VNLDEAVATVREADVRLGSLGPRPFPLPLGELAPLVAGAVSALAKGDWWVPGLRERTGAVLRGVPVERLTDGFAGARPYKVVASGGSPALRALVAVGLACADRERAALVHLGIGSAADGAFHEALNLAALLRPTVLFVVAVHPLDGDAPLGQQLAASPVALADAFGLGAVEVDGTSATAVHKAVEAARKAGGPHLIAARLPGASSGRGRTEET
jgi:TPP-dependent pyruvate/acetoin dehydrogenase alpha subunit